MNPEWIKSSYSTPSGPDCVEVATPGPDRVWVRDSKDPQRGRLAVGSDAWACFLPHAGITRPENG
ncbi:DUF397 domain-containing protein [Streptomyces fumanus]|uniref:DUF397 domain-containing protein n=1 Tax=Streptomyces fumanus TaxID=67302 RepID=UPI0033E1B5A1